MRALACDNRVELIPERPLKANVGDSSAWTVALMQQGNAVDLDAPLALTAATVE